MIFSDLYRSPRSPFSKRRASHSHGVALPPDLDADLISKDKNRQKEAVKRFLSERIRNDWDFVWPPPPTQPASEPSHAPLDSIAAAPENAQPVVPGGLKVAPGAVLVEVAPRDPGEEADSESDAESVYSTVSEDPAHFRPRLEWTSDLSDDEEPRAEAASPFRFDNPDAVGLAVNMSVLDRRARRRRAVREEVTWNPGLACFEARRNAWTGARTARVKPKPPTPISPASPRRLSFWRSHHRSESTASNHAPVTPGSPPLISSVLAQMATNTTQQTDSGSQRAPSHESNNSLSKTTTEAVQRTSTQDSSHSLYAVETLIPVPPPLLPPQNPMRASVTPSIYPSLYDKIVVHSLQPSCPVNLGDMIRACVVGWKRDGEWPPRPAAAAPVYTAADLAAMRQRKAAEERKQQHARKASTATNGSSRRLSFAFLSGGNKTGDDKDGSDEGAGKAIRRSLQKVFSLGQHSHHDAPAVASPTSPNGGVDAAAVTAKEVTAAG